MEFVYNDRLLYLYLYHASLDKCDFNLRSMLFSVLFLTYISALMYVNSDSLYALCPNGSNCYLTFTLLIPCGKNGAIKKNML